MKLTNKAIAITLGMLLVAVSSVQSAPEEPKEPEWSADIALTFVSNYVWRGYDLHQNRAIQKGQSYGSHTGAPAFQPSITVNTPIKGLWFNFFGSYATEGREDRDVDHRFQSGPGTAARTNPTITQAEVLTGLAGGYARPTCEAAGTCAPGWYAEKNGLKRIDEIDLTIGYSADSKKGTFGFGYAAYTGANPVGKNDYPELRELYFSYAPPFLPELSFIVWTDITDVALQKGNNYYEIKYAKSIELSKTMSLDVGANAGYGVQDHLQGWQAVGGNIGITVHGISIGLYAAYRPTPAFFDEDHFTATGRNSGGQPYWLFGTSTDTDGRVADPARANGPINDAINAQLQALLGTGAPGYTYTARQDMPRVLYWASIGYTISI